MTKSTFLILFLQFNLVSCIAQNTRDRSYVFENSFKYSDAIIEGKLIESIEYVFDRMGHKSCYKRDLVKVLRVFKGDTTLLNDIVDVYSEDCLKHSNFTLSSEGPGKIVMYADTCVYFLMKHKPSEAVSDVIDRIKNKVSFQRGNQVALTIPYEDCNNCIPAYNKKFYSTNELRKFIKEMIEKTSIKK
jgi:hypothetical protein